MKVQSFKTVKIKFSFQNFPSTIEVPDKTHANT